MNRLNFQKTENSQTFDFPEKMPFSLDYIKSWESIQNQFCRKVSEEIQNSRVFDEKFRISCEKMTFRWPRAQDAKRPLFDLQ